MLGLAERMAARAPATCGAAIDVPLNTEKLPLGTEERMLLPGASRVRKVALLEKDDTVSCFVVDPTLTAEEMQAGADMAFVWPSLPEATTVVMPAARKASIATLVGSESQNVVNDPPPRLMFTAAMLNVFAWDRTNSRPAIMSEVNALMQGAAAGWQALELLNWENTCTAITLASGATPVELDALPALIPATCVPWEQPSGAQGAAAPGPVWESWPFGQTLEVLELFDEKQPSATTRGDKNGCEASTPVSKTAIA